MDLNNIEFGNWVELRDADTDKVFYYDTLTKSIAWDEPADYKSWKESCITDYLKTTMWRVRENKGRTFYYNKETNKSQWDRPEELVQFEASLQELMHAKYYNEAQIVEEEDTYENKEEDTYESKEDFATTSPDFSSYHASQDFDDNNVVRPSSPDASHKPTDIQYELQKLAAKLCAVDAIMEPDILDTIERYSELSGTPPIEAIKKVVAGYVGYAQLAQITADWLNQLTSETATESASDVPTSDELMSNILAEYILAKFHKSNADNLITESSGVPSWLQDMFHVPVWRTMLIKLFDKHRGSALLGYCLKQISAAGYHREIANIIREADYFQVFNDLLVDVVTRLSDVCFDRGDDLAALVSDLCRMCCSSEYMFLYSQEALRAMEIRLTEKKRVHCDDNQNFEWAPRIKRLRQEIENPVIWKRASDSDNTIVSHGIGQQGEFSLRLTPLCGAEENEVLSVVLKMLKSRTLEENSIAKLAKLVLGDADTVEWNADVETHLLSVKKSWPILSLPQMIALFINALVLPNQRLDKQTGSLLCLLSASIVVAKNDTNADLLAQCKQTKQRIEVAVDNCREMTSLGYGLISVTKTSELLELLEDPTVSIIVLHWLHHHAGDADFIFRSMHVASFAFLAQIVVTAVELHPLQWSRCLSVIKVNNVFSSVYNHREYFQILQQPKRTMAIRYNMFDIIVHLIGKGYVSSSFKYVMEIVSMIDAGLIRHFVKCVLANCKPAYSTHFISLLCDFLCHDSVKRALQSQHFGPDSVHLLNMFMPFVLAEKLSSDVIDKVKSVVSAAGKGQTL